ncbi:ExeA family protein [Thalassoroseus pseudoceratinae]|uniref:ExeA family protein n=1 Tax=Thalassoroseus pseudoceratinae TaxID=2713176 RepID=UPI00141DF3F4|nr:AAA family ATPase [Thalassoroseus pseudoceratinae]
MSRFMTTLEPIRGFGMYASYWGLETAPFSKSHDIRHFHESEVHEEALSRLLYLIEERRRCGLLCGGPGTGKSLLLKIVDDQVRRSQRQSVLMNLPGLTGEEIPRRLAQELGIYPVPTDIFRAWTAVEDHLLSMLAFEHQAVVIFDGLERAGSGGLEAVERLVQLADNVAGGLTVILATRAERLPAGAARVAEQIDLRADLIPLDTTQIADYVTDILAQCGRTDVTFTPEAFRKLAELSEGIPRAIDRLADLSMLAAMSEDMPYVDESILEQVAAELQPQSERVAQPVSFS